MNDTKNARDLSIATVIEERTTKQSFAALTPEEEQVLRMRNGLSEEGDHELSFAVGADSDAALKLAMMEKYLIEQFSISELGSFTLDTEHIEAKARIISSMKRD